MSDENRAGGAADVLWTAWTSGERIAALPDEVRPRDDAEGFAAQLACKRLAHPVPLRPVRQRVGERAEGVDPGPLAASFIS